MIRLGRIWKLYLFYSVVLISGVCLVGFIMDRQIASTLTEHLREDVLNLAKVIAKVLPDTEDSSLLDAFCSDYRKSVEIRLTIIRKDGKVLGDSDRKAIVAENHLDRPEVREAVKGRVGTSIRYSETLKAEMLYVALPADEKGRILRVAMPMTQAKTFENKVMAFFSVALYLMPILVMVAAFLFAKYRIREGNRRESDSRRDGSE